MASDERTDGEPAAPSRRSQRDRSTPGAAEEAPAPRPERGRRLLTRAELEQLRARLQKKFH